MRQKKSDKTSIGKTQDEFYSGLLVVAFDKIAVESVYKQRANKVINLIKKYNSESKTLLELACGTGNFTKQLVEAGFDIIAIDISKDEINGIKCLQNALT